MKIDSLTQLSDDALLRALRALALQERTTTVALLAHIAEVDARRLYAPAGYPSMHAYCVGELRLSEDAAFKRIAVARSARQFPALFTLLAEGRLHLTTVKLLAPHLTLENAEGLLSAAADRTRLEIEQMLARQCSRSTPETTVRPIPAIAAEDQQAPGPVAAGASGIPEMLEVPVAPQVAAPMANERYLLQVPLEKGTYEKLRYAQALLSHSVPSGNVGPVLDRALDLLIGHLERRKFAATKRPRPRSRERATPGSRLVPAHVRRAVWERDQGRCTFVGDSGHRCGSRKLLEFDHADPVARGGESSVERMRLRCRAHNQYEAERVFGTEFMNRKRIARQRADALKLKGENERSAAEERARDVMAGLRSLGFHVVEARRGADFAQSLQGATLEESLRAAIKFLRPPRNTSARSATTSNGQGARMDRDERGATLDEAANAARFAFVSP